MYDWLTNDPFGLSVLSFLRNLVYLWIILFVLNRVVDHTFTKYNKALGVKPDEHIWAEIKEGNIAAAIYFGARVSAILIAASIIASAFIR